MKLSKKTIEDFILFLIVFGIILNTSLNVFGYPIKAGIIVGISSLFYLNKSDLSLINKLGVFYIISLLLLSIFLIRATFFNHEIRQFLGIFINFLLFTVISISLSKFYSIEKFLKYFVWVIMINSIILILEFFIPSLKLFLESILYQNPFGNIDYGNHPFRLRGLAQGGGAALGLVHVICLLMITHLRKFDYAYLIGTSFIFLSTLFISRSSLIVGFFIYTYYIVNYLHQNRNNIILVSIPFILFASVVILAQIFFTGNLFNIEWFFWIFDWTESYFETGVLSFDNSSTEQLLSETKFDFNLISFLIGNGFYSGSSSWLLQSDSGYWRMMNAVGIGSLLYYLLSIKAIIKYLPFSRLTCFLFISIFLLFEFKEPFFIQNYASRLLYLLLIIGWRLSFNNRFIRTP